MWQWVPAAIAAFVGMLLIPGIVVLVKMRRELDVMKVQQETQSSDLKELKGDMRTVLVSLAKIETKLGMTDTK